MIFKRVIWRFRICKYFHDIFKFSESAFLIFVKYIRIKNYFTKHPEISRSVALKWNVTHSCSWSLKFFRTTVNGQNFGHFTKWTWHEVYIFSVKYQYPINAFSSVCYSSKLYNSIMEAKILFLWFWNSRYGTSMILKPMWRPIFLSLNIL